MKISSKGDYALRALLTLTLRDEEKKPVRLPEIARQNKIPIKFLEQIMIQLKGAGFVTSRRGRHGGYLLAKPPQEISMGDVIRLIDGSVAPVGCVSGCDYISCVLETDCVLRSVFSDIRNNISSIVDGISFANLRDRIHDRRKVPSRFDGKGIQPPRLATVDTSAELG